MIFIGFLLKDKICLKVFGFLGKQKGGFLYFCAPLFRQARALKLHSKALRIKIASLSRLFKITPIINYGSQL